jgi:hypothetical protein
MEGTTMLTDIQNMIDEKLVEPNGVKMTESKLLSDCGPVLVVDGTPGEQYQVEIEPGDYLVIRAGATAGKASARFSHPNVAASGKVIHEFKHYRSGGSKFWSARAGVDHYFVVPRTAVKLLPVKGYSYIPAEINGIKVRFNVSGGTANGWTDWLRTSVVISVNHKVSDLKKIAEVSVRNSQFEPIVHKPLDAGDEIRWNRLASRLSKDLIEKIAKLAEEKKAPIVKFLPGFAGNEGRVVEVTRRAKKVNIETEAGFVKSWRIEYTGAVKGLILVIDGTWGRVRAKVGQIDWAATAVANGIAA